ncbi:hypothetical protein KR52_09070 [Synechococcus sp. KORDI-52]|nr:hypothetical protein KR52_09070 [Synechococcus sp. KORDI-52]
MKLDISSELQAYRKERARLRQGQRSSRIVGSTEPERICWLVGLHQIVASRQQTTALNHPTCSLFI